MSSSSDTNLSAELRTEFGKGAARRTRRAGRVPAVLYGHGQETVHLSLPGHQTALALRVANALLTIDLEGEEKLALPRQIQRDPLSNAIEHVDLIIVRRGEKVTVDVAVEVVGEAEPETLVSLEAQTVSVEAEATNIPTSFEVSVEGADVGHQVLASDLVLPEGTTLAMDPETLVVNVSAAPVIELEEDEDDEAAEGEGEDAEGEEGSEEESSSDE
ncbi:MAG TPA: 50S ribosomal protein L25/general stress protein Ctc [Candidatus Avipropionibacterium avicola]|uniref:Large ribosomal subunit protein bL25 n=1 Tax=Candidatus Avipropionibacterium avicola TaxID=2840701 RepID=A0A9D1KL95_9ACTN|nr:50S ribosomal protein L25/general stress protein Ctc [Candidatus Avipropionibacterium avicola]